MSHSFHIPVMGLSFSVDSPLKVARYGISSVASIVDDELLERMRQFYSNKYKIPYQPIEETAPDSRALRITAYLNMLQDIIHEQVRMMKQEDFVPGTDITRYFELLPEQSNLKKQYLQMLGEQDLARKQALQAQLRNQIVTGQIDVNIMAKVDKLNYDADGQMLEEHFSDALAALRGFAESKLRSSVVLSAGMNPRLYAYLPQLPDFMPDENGLLAKTIILKVSDFRSAMIQAKFLAKKGIWISEFRIESGLNCGGHAFATDGYLLGPILEEFKNKKSDLVQELYSIYQQALTAGGISCPSSVPATRFTVQGGIGTAQEHEFLMEYYQFDGTGWGSPFLLVPEATTVDDQTLDALVNADADDFYVSTASPLGVPFNNFRKSTAEQQRLERIAKGRPGSPCTKKYLVSNTEFGGMPICTASREYQHMKIKQLETLHLSPEDHQQQLAEITAKTCLCKGLTASAYLKYNLLKRKENEAVAICPGPNIAWFKAKYTLEEMIGHIYGRINLLADTQRPNLFINELNLYIPHIKKFVEENRRSVTDKKEQYLLKFKNQLDAGIAYYKQLRTDLADLPNNIAQNMLQHLYEAELQVQTIRFAKNGGECIHAHIPRNHLIIQD